MNELKEPLYKRIGHFVFDHSTALAVVLLLVVVLLASLSKVSAASMSTGDRDWLIDYLTLESYNYYYECLNAFDSYDSFICLKKGSEFYLLLFNEDTPYILPVFNGYGMSNYDMSNFFNGNVLVSQFSNGGSSGTNRGLAYNTSRISDTSLYSCIEFCNTSTNKGYVSHRPSSFTPSNTFGLFTTYSSTRISSVGSTGIIYGISGCEFFTNSDNAYLFPTYSSAASNFYKLTKNVDNSYISDDRLKLWTINNDSGSQELVIDFTDFGTDTSNSSVSYSSLSLDIEVDGVSSKIESLDRYIEKVGNPLYSSQDILAYIPYSVFDIDSALNAKVTGVSFIKQLSTQSGEPTYETFNIAVDYYLKQEVSSVSPEPIVKDPDTVSSKLTASEITSVKNLNSFASVQFHDVDLGHIVFPDNFDILFVSISGSSSLADVLNTVISILTSNNLSELASSLSDAALLNFNGVTSVDAAHNKILDILGDKLYSSVFDVIYFTYDPGNGDAYTYWYYFTEAGRLRVANSYLADIYVEANQSSYTLGSIYNFLYERLNDFEEKSLIAITGSNTLLAKSNEWLQSILNAVNNIRIPDYSGSLSSIITGINELNSKSFFDARLYNVLSAILTKLDNWPSSGGSSGSGNINNETYERFTAWLDGINDLDGIMTPEELANDQFGLIGDLYSYFAEGLYVQVDGIDLGPISYARDLFASMKSGFNTRFYNFNPDTFSISSFR